MKTKKEDFQFNDFESDISEIESTESKVWEFHKKNDVINLFSEVKSRNQFVQDLLCMYIESHKHLDPIIEEICQKYPGVKSVTFQNNYHEISKYLEKLIVLTSSQFLELNTTENLIDTNKRENILNGNKKFDHQSEFTTITENILSLLNEAKNFGNNIDKKVEEIEEEIKEEEQTVEIMENISEITPEKYEEEIETQENELEEEEEVPQTNIEEIEEKVVKGTSNETTDVVIEVEEKDNQVEEPVQIARESTPFDNIEQFETQTVEEFAQNLNVAEKSFIVEKEENNDDKEIEQIIRENFSYQDSPTIDDEEKEEIVKKSVKSKSAREYAKILLKLKKEGKYEIYEMLGRKLFAKTLTFLGEVDVEPLPYSMSQSWVMWDIAKQLYYLENTTMANSNYDLADPLESQEKQDEIVNRHIGWVVYREMMSGKVDNLLAKVQNSSYAKKIIDYMIAKPDDGKDSLPSFKLADLGKNISLAFES